MTHRPHFSHQHGQFTGPVAIGGVGGSGTRLVAQLLSELGYYLGDVNKSEDSEMFTTLFNDPKWFIDNRKNRKVMNKAINRFEKEMRFSSEVDYSLYTGWGWKNPITHFYLKYLYDYFANLKYIHVIRHGLDMAYSQNQNQLALWGEFFDIKKPDSNDHIPKASLDYWRKANGRAVRIGKSVPGDQFLVIKFDNLCSQPELEIMKIARYLNVRCTKDIMNRMSKLIKKPNTIGRYKDQDLSIFSKQELSSVRRFGFNVDI